jgi:3-hydroxyacyl-[acyl-carrier-protein] dehydratase
MWIDRFIEFRSHDRAQAVKNVSVAEEHLDDYLPGYPLMPHSLIIEGLAQAGGLLVGEIHHFERKVILAKISRARFYGTPRPGDQLLYSVKLENFQEDGALVTGTSYLGDTLQAEIDLYFAYLDNRNVNREQFEPAEFLRMMRIFGMYDVGVDQDGNRLVPVPKMLQAERLLLGVDQ